VLAASQQNQEQESAAAKDTTPAHYDPNWVSHTKRLLKEALESLERGGF